MESFFIPNTCVQLPYGRNAAVLAPHPDDEVFGCGGTLAALCREAIPVHVAILTDGQQWTADSAPQNQRRNESKCAARILGYSPPEFWGLYDSTLLNIPDLARRIETWIESLQADIVFAPSIWEMHRDHRACAQAACEAVLALKGKVTLAMYEIGHPLTPNLLVDITPVVALKDQAVACFQSQLTRQAFDRQIKALNTYRTYSLPPSVLAAEAFCLQDAASLNDLLATENPSARTASLMRADKLLNAAHRQINALEQEVTILAHKKSHLEQESARFEREMVGHAQRADQLSVIIEEHERTINTMQHTRSWRWTKPLRDLSSIRRNERSLKNVLIAWTKGGCRRLPISETLKGRYRVWRDHIRERITLLLESPNNQTSSAALARHCHSSLQQRSCAGLVDRTQPVRPFDLDLTLVTHNSETWLPGLLESLLQQRYPLRNIALLVVDNGSSDASVAILEEFASLHAESFRQIQIIKSSNSGFGAGHNQAAALGSAPFILITNPDLEFHQDTLLTLATIVQCDSRQTASWELRQMPYEHPKHYHPVTWETSWSSHACILLRREAFDSIGGYDCRIFLYGEDVEMSYRLRSNGWKLRYCPSATVTHHTYSQPDEVKPAQYLGSIIANFYLRLGYGHIRDVAMTPLLLARALQASPFPHARRQLVSKLMRDVLPHAPSLLRQRLKSPGIAPFRRFDYEQVRVGAFVPASPLQPDLPLVSVITRTMPGREDFLFQAGCSVFGQTYPNLEWIVIEDGGATHQEMVNTMATASGRTARYYGRPKEGRSAAGNHGLTQAQGRWIMFLDDDDLLYADHIETLARALLGNPGCVAAYALAWEIPTDVDRDGRLREGAYVLNEVHCQEFDYDLLRTINYIPIQTILFEQRLYAERGGFDPTLHALEDWHLWQRYAHGNHFIHVPKITSLYRVPMSVRTRQDRQKTLDQAYHPVKAKAEEAIAALSGQASRR